MGKKGTSPEDEFLMEIVREDYFDDSKGVGASTKKNVSRKRKSIRKGGKKKRSETGKSIGKNGKVIAKKGKKNGKFPSLKPWMKVTLGVAVFLLVAAAGLFGSFVYLRAEGEKNLKVDVEERMADSEVEEEKREGLFITYNGKEYQYNEDVINFLCLGIDKATSIEDMKENMKSQGNSDVLMLVSLNVENGMIKVFAIPRDTMVSVKVFDTEGRYVRSETAQITTQHAYGHTEEEACELTVEAVSNLLYKVPIQRYCSINFLAVPILNDAVGGVDVDVLEYMQGSYGTYQPGDRIHLEGDMALEYIRLRDHSAEASAMLRLERQKQYLINFFQVAKEAMRGNLTLPVTIYQQLQDNQYMHTNITLADITYLVPKILDTPLSMEDLAMIPGESAQPGEYEEYHVNQQALKELVIQSFYREVP